MKPSTAHAIVHKAKETGLLTPQPCEICGSTNVVAHHDDYDKPLEVRWLCQTDHRKHHKYFGQGKNWEADSRAKLAKLEVWLPREEAALIREICKAEERTLSGLMRKLLREYVAEEKTKQGEGAAA